MKSIMTQTVRANSQAGRDAQIIDHLPQVRAIARRMHITVPPSVTFDDLVAAGTLGLIQAVDRFESSCGIGFCSYAQHRIRGAMLDFLRGEDPLSRGERSRLRQTNPDCGPVTISLDESRSNSRNGPAADSHDAAIIRTQSLISARRCLSRRENHVVDLLYYSGRSNVEVATRLGVNESRVSQLKTRALSKLRRQLSRSESAA